MDDLCCGSLGLSYAVRLLKAIFRRGNQRLAGGRKEIRQDYRHKLEIKIRRQLASLGGKSHSVEST